MHLAILVIVNANKQNLRSVLSHILHIFANLDLVNSLHGRLY